MHCLLCQTEIVKLDELEDIQKKTPFSKKAVHAIITYLAKTANPPIDVIWPDESSECRICKICFEDILIYDEYMVKLLEVQKRIISSLRNPLRDEKYITIQPLDEFIDDVDIKDETSNQENIEVGGGGDIESGKAMSLGQNNCPGDDSEDGEDVANKLYNDIDGKHIGYKGSVRNYNIPVICDLCYKIFGNKTQLRVHKKIEHKPFKKIWKCETCGITVKDEEYLELHRNIHEGKSDLECRYCTKRYTRKINVIRHMQKHWDKKKFQCERCGLRFSERPIYYNHRLQHEAEEDPLICAVCNQSFKTRRTYRNHLWTHREDRPRYGCEICGKTFVEKYTLKVHLRSHNENEGERSGGRRKIIPTAIHEEDKTFECIICGDLFTSKDLYDQHMDLQHDVILKDEHIFV